MHQLMLAVNYIHLNKVIHRNIKPENILLEDLEQGNDVERYVLKLIGFGSSVNNQRDLLKDAVGSSYYMAPEVIDGKYDEKCDNWSCGIILYILLSGQPPFIGKSDKEILRRV